MTSRINLASSADDDDEEAMFIGFFCRQPKVPVYVNTGGGARAGGSVNGAEERQRHEQAEVDL